MPRPQGTKNIQVEKTTEIEELETKLREAKEKARMEQHKKEAKKSLEDIESSFHSDAESATTLEDIYNLSKGIFFTVNGARRVLKNDQQD